MNSYCQPSGTSHKASTEDVDESTVLVATCVAKGHKHYRLCTQTVRQYGVVSGAHRSVQQTWCARAFTHATKARICTGTQDALAQTCFPNNGLPLLRQNLRLSPKFCNTVQRPLLMLCPRLTLYIHCEQTQSTPTWHKRKGAFQTMGCSTKSTILIHFACLWPNPCLVP